jgi:tetratricopeptide (TPR) repeat protein
LDLTPPTPSEARKFIRARLPHLPSQEQDAIVRTAGRSYETIRTLTLLSEVRAPLPEGRDVHDPSERLVDLMRFGGDERLRDFLAALATVRLPQHPTFTLDDLNAVRNMPQGSLNDVERAFLDPSPDGEGRYRCFSRRLGDDLRAYLQTHEPVRAKALHAQAAAALETAAYAAPDGPAADRYLHHLFDARDFQGLMRWMANGTLPHTLISRAWSAAETETHDDALLDAFAEHVVQHYVTLGSYRHPDAERAFKRLRTSSDTTRRAWAEVTQAEGAVLRGAFEEAMDRLRAAPDVSDPRLQAEAALLRASEARWRGNLEEAVRHVEEGARSHIEQLDLNVAANALTRSKLAVWAGLIHKDRGLPQRALEEFTSVQAANPLVRARLAFQQADALMLLGRLQAALKQFDQAVHLAERSGALASERTRYLARRASLNVRLGALASAEADFEAADRLLATVDRPHRVPEVWKARVNDERILLLLARGRFDEAVATAADVAARYARHGTEHGIDATFRIDRATLRLGLAYVARSFGRPWAAPYPSPATSEPREADHDHGLDILKTLAAGREARLAGHEGLEPLTRRILMILALVDRPEDAARAAERLVAAGGPAFARAEAHARLADAQLRLGRVAQARSALEAAWPLLHQPGEDVFDPGATAHLHRVALALATYEDRDDAAFDALASLASAALPSGFVRETLWAWGAMLEQHGRSDWLTHPRMPAGLAGLEGEPQLRTGDRLAVRHDRRGLPAPPAHALKEGSS